MTTDRYHRQMLVPQIGTQGQNKLGKSCALIVGCGALGSTIAEQLARAGLGTIRIVDRDIVELTNLQRQVMFDESDVSEGVPKAIAAAKRMHAINSEITVDPRVLDVDGSNIEDLCAGVHVILDGTDNVATRYLINDVSVKLGIPWVYGACIGTEGRVMTILPEGPCLRCVFRDPPNPRELPTCDTAGVLGSVASFVGSMQSLSGIKLLSGNASAIPPELLSFELWTNRIHSTNLKGAKRPDCPACGQRKFEFLQRRDRDMTARLCGRNIVQVRAIESGKISLPAAAKRLEAAGRVSSSPFLVRCSLREGGLSLTAFEDGRVLVQGTTDPAKARSVVAKYFGA